MVSKPSLVNRWPYSILNELQSCRECKCVKIVGIRTPHCVISGILLYQTTAANTKATKKKAERVHITTIHVPKEQHKQNEMFFNERRKPMTSGITDSGRLFQY